MQTTQKYKKTAGAEAQNFVSFKKQDNAKNRIALIIVGSVLLLIGMSILQITAFNMLSTKGIALDVVQRELAEVQRENMVISEKLYSMSSYTHIASEAATLGFVNAKPSVIFIEAPHPIARR